MYEKQSSIKDMTTFKNNIKDILPEGFSADYNGNDIVINNPKGRKIFKGKVGSNPIGCHISGEFMAERFVSRLAMIVVVIYVAVLIFTFSMGQRFYDYQVFMMIVGVLVLAFIKKYTDVKVGNIRDALEELK